MGVYDRQIANAQRLIAAKGVVCDWQSAEAGELVDETKPWKPAAATPKEYQAAIVFLPKNTNTAYLRHDNRGTPIGDLIGLMGAVAFTPQIEDIIECPSGEKYRVGSADPIAPNGDVILWTLGLFR